MTTIDLFQHSGDALLYPAESPIFNAGDSKDYAYIVIQGEVDLIVNGTNVETVGPGGIFGEMALIEQKPRIASAVARTDCRVVRIDEKQFMFLVQVTPNFAICVMRILAERLRRMDELLYKKVIS
jgi:CRP/FNR family transcriptional regulator, cyclic AMP receptor protein